ncbi:ubiquitin-like protein 7 [Moschus berezovskii]|uniref:ubiquitin-like protein 7 n=1 Tax=Moschus berezovskii TaxID=68408 RepID=UPI00244502DC|nr:ubiquitin-like protein 7 [Moschus berezovskii]
MALWVHGCPYRERVGWDKPSSAYRDMPGGFLFEGLSDDEDDFHPESDRAACHLGEMSARSTPSSSTPSSRPASLGYSGAAGPRPITQSELATALALASTPESSSHMPTPGTQGHSSGTSPMSSSVQSGTPITNDLFSQALQHALQASGQSSLQVSLPPSDVHMASLVLWMLSFSLLSGGPSHLACFAAGTAGAWQRDRRGCSLQGQLSLRLPLLHPVPMAWLH